LTGTELRAVLLPTVTVPVTTDGPTVSLQMAVVTIPPFCETTEIVGRPFWAKMPQRSTVAHCRLAWFAAVEPPRVDPFTGTAHIVKAGATAPARSTACKFDG